MQLIGRVFDRSHLRTAIVALVVLGTAYVVAGCFMCTYTRADAEPGVRQLIGRRCILARTVDLPARRPHFFPTLDPPDRLPTVTIGAGTVLRVTHAERWQGPIDPSGNVCYAEVEGGPLSGQSVVVGSLAEPAATEPRRSVVLCENSRVGLSADAGSAIHPYQPADDGYFYPYPWPEELKASRLLTTQPGQ